MKRGRKGRVGETCFLFTNLGFGLDTPKMVRSLRLAIGNIPPIVDSFFNQNLLLLLFNPLVN